MRQTERRQSACVRARGPLTRAIAGVSLLALAACSDFDMDMRDLGNAFDTTEAARAIVAQPRPRSDDRGIISYPNYQVAVARRGDTVADVATRIGLPVDELARYNGVPENAVLNRGEILALPRRVPEVASATAATSAVLPESEAVDVTTLAAAAIDRAAPSSASTATDAPAPTPVSARAPQVGPEPERHKVGSGETAYSIARRYGVSVRDLAEWNGLGRDLELREGQYLLIPVAAATPRPAGRPDVSQPGQGSSTPTPPSAAAPLPDEEVQPAASPKPPEGTPTSPDLGSQATSASAGDARFIAPVGGSIIRDFKKGQNEGIDIAAPAGSAVKAAGSGTVAAITRDTDQIPILVLRHDGGLLTVYANVDDLTVNKGDRVKKGQQIAKVRAADPAFLHFEVREGLEAVDPGDYLN